MTLTTRETRVMTDKPILFNGDMVRAILRDTLNKTQTRRVLKPQPEQFGDGALLPLRPECPYGYIGDRLWVRETWKPVEIGDDEIEEYAKRVDDPETIFAGLDGVMYAANDAFIPIRNTLDATDKWGKARRPQENYPHYGPVKWRPSIHMPRWASRITLEITHVRAERLQEITEGDAIAEGVSGAIRGDKVNISSGNTVVRVSEPILDFAALWDSINAARGFGWDANPWVWVLTFKRLTP